MRLTAAEHDVALLVARGMTNAEIAAERRCSPNTVRQLVSLALIRTGYRNRVELAVAVARGEVRGPALRRAA